MRIRHLRLRVNTDHGMHGTDISFPDGLVILRADNTMGKSTCIQAILVALGFEAMLTTSQRDLPLPPAMKAELESDGALVTVIESDIYLELENTSGKRIVVHRSVRGTRNKDLVTVTHGPALTVPTGLYKSDDFFVSRPGSATRSSGYHHFLTEFFGWHLPAVQTFDGREHPLYLQCIFPYVIVEQTRGWASIDPPVPTQFRIREPHKRTVEFLLDLDAYHLVRKRLELDQRTAEIEAQWSLAVKDVDAQVKAIGGRVDRLPSKPIASWPPEIPPAIVLPQDGEWVPAEELLALKQNSLQELVDKEIPRVSDVLQSAELQLANTQAALSEKENLLARLLQSLVSERGEFQSTAERLEKIDEDLQRNKDVKTLLLLGATTAPNITKNACPTCHQPIIDSLAPLALDQKVMSIDENISFLKAQRIAFQTVLRNVEALVDARSRQVTVLREEIANDRARIRALKQTLVSDARLPSRAAIQTQLELQHQIGRIQGITETFSIRLYDFEKLADDWARIQTDRKKLPSEDTSIEDRKKLTKWSDVFVNQLGQYDFRSFSPGTVMISQDSYKPTREGFDLPTNISASDFIRVIWSYLTSLLELSRDFTTNHPGLLVFDEPKQQSAKDLSFEELLKRVSVSANFGQQVIFATSEDPEKLKQMLATVPHTYRGFTGRIITHLAELPDGQTEIPELLPDVFPQLQEMIENAFRELEFWLEDEDGEVLDVIVNNVEILSQFPIVSSQDQKVIEITARVSVSADVSYDDPDTVYYDKEEDRHIAREQIQTTLDRDIEIQAEVHFSVSSTEPTETSISNLKIIQDKIAISVLEDEYPYK